jgi:hypothetical protein
MMKKENHFKEVLELHPAGKLQKITCFSPVEACRKLSFVPAEGDDNTTQPKTFGER